MFMMLMLYHLNVRLVTLATICSITVVYVADRFTARLEALLIL
jgi:hypothetical protein